MRDIDAGEIVEVCHVIVFPSTQAVQWARDYAYVWNDYELAVALGFGSLYNHAHLANTIYRINPDAKTITYIAARRIARGEELTINYEFLHCIEHLREDFIIR